MSDNEERTPKKAEQGDKTSKGQKRRGRPTLAEQLGRQRANSVGSLLGEQYKRRREEEEEKEREKVEKEFIEQFQKTRKIGRSPPEKRAETEKIREQQQVKMNRDTNMEKLTELMLTIKQDTEEIKKENRELRSEIKEMKEEWNKKLESWEKERKELENQTKILKDRITRLEKKEDNRERRERKNNIIIKGEELTRKETPRETVEYMLKKELQVEAEVEEAFWIGKGNRSILLAKLRSWHQKREVMIKKKNLKGKKLYIDNDLTKKERDIQQNIVDLAKVEKAEGAQVKIGYRKLQIDDKIFVWKEKRLKEVKFWSRQSSRNN